MFRKRVYIKMFNFSHYYKSNIIERDDNEMFPYQFLYQLIVLHFLEKKINTLELLFKMTFF